MNSKRDSKRTKPKQQQAFLSPLPRKNGQEHQDNPFNLHQLSPFRPYHPSQLHGNFSANQRNSQMQIIETPAPRDMRCPPYEDPIDIGNIIISGQIDWNSQSEQQSNIDGGSSIGEISQESSQKQSEKMNEQNMEKNETKDINNHNLRTAQPKQKKEKDSNKKLSQSTISSSNSKKVFCNCKKTKCLKLYCDCFRIGQTCDGCNCVGCHNITAYEEQRNNSMLSLMDRNAEAFKPKIQGQQHAKGCRCRKSYCLKKYCECYQVGLKCGSNCKCQECKNMGDEPIRKDRGGSNNELVLNLQNLLNDEQQSQQKLIKPTIIKRQKKTEQKVFV